MTTLEEQTNAHQQLTQEEWLKIIEGVYVLDHDVKYRLGKFIVQRWFGQALPFQEEATNSLTAMGFEVNWLTNIDGDILILELERWPRYTTHKVEALDQFILEFTGHDDVDIALYDMIKHGGLEDDRTA